MYNFLSVISDCDTQTACFKILNYFDPNRGKNYKTKILNVSNINICNENNIKYYNITSTKNLSGYVRFNKFDMILYEPPYNKTLIKQTFEYAKIFKEIINNNGLIICKVNDFKIGNQDELNGSFELQKTMLESGFYLSNKIIYRYNPHGKYLSSFENTDKFTITHFYFMIFKRKTKNDMPNMQINTH